MVLNGFSLVSSLASSPLGSTHHSLLFASFFHGLRTGRTKFHSPLSYLIVTICSSFENRIVGEIGFLSSSVPATEGHGSMRATDVAITREVLDSGECCCTAWVLSAD